MFVSFKEVFSKKAGLTGRAPRSKKLPAPITFAASTLPEELTPPPLKWSPLGNLNVGDCVEAEGAHAIQAALFTLWGETVDFTTTEVVDTYNLYRREYDAGKDLGTDPSIFEEWMESGLWGWKASFASVATDETTLQSALLAHGNVGLDVVLHKADINAFNGNQRPWVVTASPGEIYGYHALCLVGFNRSWFYGVTWGKVIRISPRWIQAYTQAATVLVSPTAL